MTWVRVTREERDRGATNPDELVRRTRVRLGGEDPRFGHLHRLAPDVQERERGFTAQSLRGIIGQLEREMHPSLDNRKRDD